MNELEKGGIRLVIDGIPNDFLGGYQKSINIDKGFPSIYQQSNYVGF